MGRSDKRGIYTQHKTMARLHAVQGLYRHDVMADPAAAPADAGAILHDLKVVFENAGADDDMAGLEGADMDMVQRLVDGSLKYRDQLDALIAARLSSGWTLERIGALMRALLRVAVYELEHEKATPSTVVIDEYVTLAKAFFDNEKIGFVNGLLNAVANGNSRA